MPEIHQTDGTEATEISDKENDQKGGNMHDDTNTKRDQSDKSDWQANDNTTEAPHIYSGALRVANELKTMSAGELLSSPEEPVSWLVSGFMQACETGILSGAPKSKKTWVADYLGASVAAGMETVFGSAKEGVVLVIDEEGGKRLQRKRLLALTCHWPKDKQEKVAKNLHFLTFSGLKFDERGFAKLERLVTKLHPVLIIVDTFRRIFPSGKNEDSSGDVASIFSEVIMPLKRMGVAILLLHHNRKPSQNSQHGSMHEMRGSSDIPANVDVVWLAEGHGKTHRFTLHNDKMRNFAEMKPVHLVLVDGEDGAVSIVRLPDDTEQRKDTDVEMCLGVLTNALETGPLKNRPFVRTRELVTFGKERHFGKKTVERALETMVESCNLEKTGRGKYSLPKAEKTEEVHYE